MKNLLFFAVLVMLIFNASCRSDDEMIPEIIPEEITQINQYSQLTPGNFWIYQAYQENADGELEPHSIDSSYIEKDTTINGSLFVKMIEHELGSTITTFLRDSANYIVNEEGKRLFSFENIGEKLFENDINIGQIDYYMVGEQSIETDLGDVDALLREGVINLDDPTTFPACGIRPSKWFAKDIGVVKTQVHYLFNCRKVTRELLRYSVE